MHERAALRQAIVAALRGQGPAFATSARDRVTASRFAPVRLAELPTINVYVDAEEITVSAAAPREYERKITMAIEAWVAATGGTLDDDLDALALQIEAAMDADPWFAGAAGDSVLTVTEVGIKSEGDRPMGCVHLEYAVTYHTTPRILPVPDSFLTADVQYTGPQLAHDVIEVAP